MKYLVAIVGSTSSQIVDAVDPVDAIKKSGLSPIRDFVLVRLLSKDFFDPPIEGGDFSNAFSGPAPAPELAFRNRPPLKFYPRPPEPKPAPAPRYMYAIGCVMDSDESWALRECVPLRAVSDRHAIQLVRDELARTLPVRGCGLVATIWRGNRLLTHVRQS